MYMSEDIKDLVSALSKAQVKMNPATKDKKNPYFNSKYADLSSVWNACRDVLGENGLAVVQSVEYRDSKMLLVTTLAHVSGQWMKSEIPIILTKNDPQSIGSAISYFRRYSLASMVGICPEDDDGEAAVGRSSVTVRNAKKEVRNPINESPLQILEIRVISDGISNEFLLDYLEWVAMKKKQPIDQVINSVSSTELYPNFKAAYTNYLTKRSDLVEVVA